MAQHIRGRPFFLSKKLFPPLLKIDEVDENRADRYKARTKINRRRIFDTLRINFCAATQ